MVQPHCVCAIVPRIDNRTKILVVRHTKEAQKSTNTVRLARLALTRMEVHDYGVWGNPFDPSVLDEEEMWALFPDSGRTLPAGRPKTLVVMDGTWSQVRQMSHRVQRFSTLPRVTLRPPETSVIRLRQPSHPEGMSTIEAIGHALNLLEGPEVGEPLLTLHDRYVEAVLRARGAWSDPTRDPGQPT